MIRCSMDQNDRDEAVDGPVVSEGGRSPSTLSPGQGTPLAGGGTRQGPLAPSQRWSAARKREVGLRLMRGEAAELLAREVGLPLFKLEQWRQKAEAALEGALKERESDPAEGQLAAAMQRIGELSMEIELLRAKMERPGPLARRRARSWRTRPPQPPAAATVSRGSATSGRFPDPRSMPRARQARTIPRGSRAQHAAVRSLPSPTRTCWRRSGLTSCARPGPARAIARCGLGCGRWTASRSRASGCCG